MQVKCTHREVYAYGHLRPQVRLCESCARAFHGSGALVVSTELRCPRRHYEHDDEGYTTIEFKEEIQGRTKRICNLAARAFDFGRARGWRWFGDFAGDPVFHSSSITPRSEKVKFRCIHTPCSSIGDPCKAEEPLSTEGSDCGSSLEVEVSGKV